MNKAPSFAHLHLHSANSLLDGLGNPFAYITKAKELKQNYIAITDHGNINGTIQWQKECDRQGMGCILGSELYIVPNLQIKQKGEKRGHIVLLTKNRNGWKTLCSLLTTANLQGFYHRPRIDYNLLLNSDLSGLIVLTGCVGSFLTLPGGEELLSQLCQKTGVYLEIMPHNIPTQHKIHIQIKQLSKKFPEVQFVATNDVHYIEKEDWEAQEVLLAIQSKAKWTDPKRWKFGFKGLHLRTADEMLKAFKIQNDWSEDIVKQAMTNTIRIARQCFQFRIPKQEVSLPLPPGVQTGKEDVTLDAICKEGYERIFGDNNWPQIYKDRYLEEFELIKKKKFVRYFLIIQDLIQWSRDNNIACGPGRGSSSGSLIAFLSGITLIDPIKFNLSFSRFLSEDRNDLPDIDCDFEKRHRDKVIEYLIRTYGKNHTCNISTIGRMQAKGVIRDVSRVMEIPTKDINDFANSVWNREDEESAIITSINNTKEGKYFAKKYPKVTQLILKLEGQAKFAGIHPSAIIISADNLTESDRCVLIKSKNKIACNWEMNDVEKLPGLLKLDVLGLSTLSVLAEAKNLINRKDNPKGFYYRPESDDYLFISHMKREMEERYKSCEQIDFDFNKIQWEDKKTFEKISAGNTSGMFQLSGHSCTELCKKMKIHSFEDIVAVISLARPGPADSGMTEEYVERKHGLYWTPVHPIYEEVTKDTYGIIVYQEQVMQVISKVAGLSESIADKIRKIIAKKSKAEQLIPYWNQFKNGCHKMKTLSKKEAESFWEELNKHASYSFNRSHAVAYALIGYWTAFLKTHCREEFYAASLTFGEWNEKSRDKNKHKNSLLSEIKEIGYSIVTPKKEYSDTINWKFIDKNLYIPFVELTGVGESNAAKCLKSVKKGRVQGFFGKDYNISKSNETKLDLLLKEMRVDNNDTIPSNIVLTKYLPHIKLELLNE